MKANFKNKQPINLLKLTKNLSLAILGSVLSFAAIEVANPAPSDAFVIFNRSGSTLGGGSRWDAAPRTIHGKERSLDGGLRYSLQGGSYQAYRDLFTWDILPSVNEFQNAIEAAFNAWTVVDPVSGLGTDLSFVADLETPVVGTGRGGVNRYGAEIDLFASTDATFWNPGHTSPQGEAFFYYINDTVTLTSGTENYAGSSAIIGADITFNNNAGTVYTLDFFRRLLTHEIGHAIGLGDIEGDISPNRFIDDNYDGSTSATALATLSNPIAQLIDPLNPAASPFSLFTVPDQDPGVDTPGVDILMESRGLGIAPGNPVTNLTPLVNDDYAGRQFLYPVFSEASVSSEASVDEPTATLGLLALGIIGARLITQGKKASNRE
ncbi:MAG: hypothetical protein F6J94_03630 [Moorea sp. SIO1F2]|uniref:hypothetical protein n=1 Tax=Moorena sp. SIO1F2 TaxID=2607819 RepID=UPI0013BB9872|nr:hypothetical protein [Moorena sp. SIO1F2]NET81081.1 hypothetical protein [Moorena sp. SIO1F2]